MGPSGAGKQFRTEVQRVTNAPTAPARFKTKELRGGETFTYGQRPPATPGHPQSTWLSGGW